MGTLIIMLLFVPSLWWSAVVDFFAHALVDRLKGKITLNEAWQTKDTMFWWAFGADQELHNLTHLAYIVIVFVHLGGIFQ